MDPSLNLVRQCIAGTGTVQINIEIKRDSETPSRFNIVDVLQPPPDLEDENGCTKCYIIVATAYDVLVLSFRDSQCVAGSDNQPVFETIYNALFSEMSKSIEQKKHTTK